MPSASASRSTLLAVFAALLALLVVTALAAQLPRGPWSLPIALVIATAKLVLIFLYFMRLRYMRGMVRVFAAAAFFWLAISLVLTSSDYLTRGWGS